MASENYKLASDVEKTASPRYFLKSTKTSFGCTNMQIGTCSRLSFTLDVHETLLALTLLVYFRRLGYFFSLKAERSRLQFFYNSRPTSNKGMGAGGNGNNQWEW